MAFCLEELSKPHSFFETSLAACESHQHGSILANKWLRSDTSKAHFWRTRI
jgi:hypothetical protein